VVDFVGEGGAERDAVLMLGTRGVDVLVGYGGRLDVEILSEGLFPETSFLSSIVGTYNEAVKLVALVARGALKLTKTTFPLEGVNDALHALDEGRMIGRGVLVPNES
jgi:NAD+-dependent secondary alcohol dehydrogenase Adh1